MYLVNQESTRRGNRKKKQGQTKTGLEPTRKTGFETDNGVEMAILFSPDEPDACSTTRNKQRQKPILKKKRKKKAPSIRPGGSRCTKGTKVERWGAVTLEASVRCDSRNTLALTAFWYKRTRRLTYRDQTWSRGKYAFRTDAPAGTARKNLVREPDRHLFVPQTGVHRIETVSDCATTDVKGYSKGYVASTGPLFHFCFLVRLSPGP